MNDDIVTRLRQKYAGQLPICTEAADEIERLREHMGILVDHNVELMEEVDSLKAVANGQFSSTSETRWKRDE